MFERLRVWTRAVARRGDVEREMRDEMRAHVERAAERLMARGLSASEARALAAREFGNVGVLEEAARDARGVRWVDELQQDVRYAARSLRRDPLLAVFVTLTLGLGIGANAAMFGVVDRLLLRGPEHVRDAARLRRLYTTARNRGGEQQTDAAFGYVTYALLSNGARSLDGVAAYQMGDGTL